MRIIDRILFRGWWARILSAIIQVSCIAVAFTLLDDENFLAFSFIVNVGFLGGQIFGGGWGRKLSSAQIFSGNKNEFIDGIRNYITSKLCVLGIAFAFIPLFLWLSLQDYIIIISYNYFFLFLFIGVGLFCAEIVKSTRFFIFSFLFERSLPPVLSLCAILLGIYPSIFIFYISPLIYSVFFYLLLLSSFPEGRSVKSTPDGYFGFRSLWNAKSFITSSASDALVYRVLSLTLPFSLYDAESSAKVILVASALNFLNIFFDAKAFSFFKSFKETRKEFMCEIYVYYKNCFISFLLIMMIVFSVVVFFALGSTMVREYLSYIGILLINSFFVSLSFGPIYFLQGAGRANIITIVNIVYFGLFFVFLILFPNADMVWLGLALGISSALRFYTVNFYVAAEKFS